MVVDLTLVGVDLALKPLLVVLQSLKLLQHHRPTIVMLKIRRIRSESVNKRQISLSVTKLLTFPLFFVVYTSVV